jgi:hypothetical protein
MRTDASATRPSSPLTDTAHRCALRKWQRRRGWRLLVVPIAGGPNPKLATSNDAAIVDNPRFTQYPSRVPAAAPPFG